MSAPGRMLQLCLLPLLASLVHSAALAPSARFFAPDLIAGTYKRRIPAQAPPDTPCPSEIGLAGYANHPEKGVTVEHVQITAGGKRCTGAGEIVMSNADHAVETEPIMSMIRNLSMKQTIAEDLVKQGGAFLGVSEQPMQCGEAALPKNAFYAFVNETKETIFLIGRLRLLPGKRHMVIVLGTGEEETYCAYEAKPGVPGPEFVKSKDPALEDSKPTAPTDKPAAGTPANGNPTQDPLANQPSSSVGIPPLSLEESPEPSPDLGPGPACFPADALVPLSTGQVVRMDALRVGDSVQTSSGSFSLVFMFTHRAPEVISRFVELRTAAGRVLRASPEHLLYLDGALQPARSAKAGMRLTNASGATDAVVQVRSVEGRGLFNPQTEDGDIVVDGFVASVYTEAVRPAPAHALLAPMRAGFRALGMSSSALEEGVPLLRWCAARVLS